MKVSNRSSLYRWCPHAAYALIKTWDYSHCCTSRSSRFRYWWGTMGQIAIDSNRALGRSCSMGFCCTSKNQIRVVTVPLVQFNGYVTIHFLSLAFCMLARNTKNNYMLHFCLMHASYVVTCFKLLLILRRFGYNNYMGNKVRKRNKEYRKHRFLYWISTFGACWLLCLWCIYFLTNAIEMWRQVSGWTRKDRQEMRMNNLWYI